MTFEFVGSPLEDGPLPAVFYFALSAKNSLHLDPYNQPVVILSSYRLRVFSMTLPEHDRLPPEEAIDSWTEEMVEAFTDQAAETIENLAGKNVIDRVGIMGLSRGVFIGAHVAAKTTKVRTLLGFAPLTRLASMPSLNLENLADDLCDRTIRCSIGNRDTRVGTEHCFHFITKLAESAYHKGIRSSPIELIVVPSIGQMGHGTSPEAFRSGAAWMAERLI